MSYKLTEPVASEEALRAIMGHPTEVVNRKTIDHLDEHCRKFIARSPFLTVATSDGNGRFDVSPKGDPPGFVSVLDAHHLAIPDRPGNRKADTLSNIIAHPYVGLIFFIPGVRETLRVNGDATVVRDPELRKALSCQDKVPDFAIVVRVREAFMHCAKCIIRSKLWSGGYDVDATELPTLGRALVDHAKLAVSPEELDAAIREDERTNLY